MLVEHPKQIVLVPSVQSQMQLGFLKQTKNYIIQKWTVVIKTGNLRWEVITFLFFRVIGFFSSSFSYKCEAAWGHVVAFYLRCKAAQKEAQLQNEIEDVRKANLKLSARLQNLMEEITVSEPTHRQLFHEKEEAFREIQHLTEERRQIFFDRASVLAQKDCLFAENQRLKEEKQQLMAEKELILQEKTDLENRCNRALQELTALQLQFNRLEDYRLLTERLGEFHQLYSQLPQNPEEQRGMTQMALDQLIPCYKKHREKLHVMLKAAIDRLPDNSLEKPSLKGILRLSEEETLHLEKISQTLHLIEALRTTFTQYFQRVSR